jgi:hypothetical protein
MATEQVRVWRPADEDRVLLMAGQTTHYGSSRGASTSLALSLGSRCACDVAASAA